MRGPSLPSRERGLKFADGGGDQGGDGSLPSRERGLKSVNLLPSGHSIPVAPFAGAWIEMLRAGYSTDNVAVAPFAGAWIEIS